MSALGEMITNRTITVKHFGDDPLAVSGLSFERCFFDNSTLGGPSKTAFRAVLSDLYLKGCKQRACNLAGAILENIIVDGLTREGRIPVFLNGVAFRHVTLKGKISFFKLLATPYINPTTQQLNEWNAANIAFYSAVDWALDISETLFTSVPDLQCIPGSLIRFDPHTQARVTREKLLSSNWRSISWGRSSLYVVLQWFIDYSPYSDVVLVAPKKSASFNADLEALVALRKLGIAEPR